MERAKVRYNIEDYSVSQTTLEQVFLNFARAQISPNTDLEETPSCWRRLRGCVTTSCRCCSCCQEEYQDEELPNIVVDTDDEMMDA